MRVSALITILFFSFQVSAAEFQGKKPVKILELNEKTLLNNVWPGMTIKQAIQILGDPEEVLSVEDSIMENAAQAVRYGIYWLIPQHNGLQIECIINQRGFRSYYDRIRKCRYIDDKYKLATQ